MAFLIEDVQTEGKYGIVFSQEKKLGSIGTICAIADDNEADLKVGDRVVYSKFVFDDINVPDKDGNPVKHLKYGPHSEIPAKLI